MDIPEQPAQAAQPSHLHVPAPIVARWKRVRACYRYANLATHHVLGFVVKTTLFVYFAFAVLLLVLRYVVLPNIDLYKPEIERLAGRALGNQVTIERLYAAWDGLRPSLFLGDVTLRDAQGRQVLALPSVQATLSWWSVMAREVRFESLAIIRPQLAARRDASGALFIAGVRIDPNQSGDGSGADWLLRQREIVIREGRVVWTDAQRGAAPLALDGVALVLQNNWNSHRFALRATPPRALAQPLDVRAAFTHPPFVRHPSNARLWRGEMYLDLRETDLAAWKPYLDYPFALTQGKGSLRAWLTLDQARLAGFTADVGLAGVAAQLAPHLPPLALARMSGRVAVREELHGAGTAGKPTWGAYGHAITLTNFALTTGAGLQLPPTTLAETFVPARAGKLEQGSLRVSTLELGAVAELAAQLPLSDYQRTLLADFAPQGTVNDVALAWRGRYPAAQASFKVKAAVQGLRLTAQPARAATAATATAPARAARPALAGVDNLSGAIQASEQGGSVAVASDNLVLHLGPWFAEDAFPLDALAVKARWSFPHKKLQVDIDQAEARQGKLKAALSGRHVLSLDPAHPGGPGVTDLKGSVDGFEIASIGRYLPLKTSEHLRDWLTGALVGGSVHDVRLRLRGDLAHFPFRADTPAERALGEFHVAGRIQNGKLNYAPARHAPDGKSPLWPLAEQINGSIVFDRTRMEINAASARTAGVALSKVQAVVPDLASHDMQLEIDGGASGALQEFLRYMQASPVLGWIGHFTEDTKATGNATLGLSLRLPLARLHEAGVNGALQLQGNEIDLLPDLPTMHATRGTIGFTEHGVALTGLGASFLGGPLAVSGGTQPDGAIVIKLGGTLSSDGIRQAYPAPAMQRVADHITGNTRYTGLVEVREHHATVTVDTTLAGLGLSFPAPLAKPAADALPLHFVLTGKAATDAGAARDEIKVSLGTNMAARYERERPLRGMWTVTRGGIGVNVPAPEPQEGMMINVNMKSLNVDQWLALGGAIADAREAAPAMASAGPGMAQYFIPSTIAARATVLELGERKLNDVVVGASHQQNVWQANIDSRQVSGHVSWSESSGQAMGKVTARLASLNIPESTALEVKDLLENDKSAAANIPALDIVAENFELFNKQFGRLELQASNAKALAGREWRIEKLALSNPDGALNASGRWVTRDGKSNTGMNFKLDIVDAGRLLDRLGFPGTVRRGKGELNGDIGWSGLPYSLDIPSLSGQIELNVANGQFLKQDPGAAKLLGVLSLQALPRLLKLDFHDVFSDGLAFDGITANAVINRGVVKTNNLNMHGIAATVLMDGSADIANESTNLHVVVIPEFNLGTGPLMYGLAVNPVIGLGSFLAQWFLRAPVMKALTYQMMVTGPWKAPVITKLDEKPEVPVMTRVK
ncbi:YhdP family protein [Massilia sp. S19_KUP03_FR1]|uniref:YhdP family protein n=1 Tax=Massilia sp. S19_KUP03_FR1 TaxID=3025503 RepID=UPI002FCDB696